jgi:hypothetical protein
MLLWIISDIQNFLITQKLAWTTFLRTLNFLNAVPYAVLVHIVNVLVSVKLKVPKFNVNGFINCIGVA